MLRNILFVCSLAIVMALQMGGSCASTSTSGSGSSGDYDSSTPSYDRPHRIPRQSDLVRDGDGKLKWTADLDGEIYVYDAGKDHIDYTGPVRRGQEVVVNPKDDKVTVGDRVVSTENLRKDASHQIYFVRQRESRNDHDRWSQRAMIVREGRGEITFRAERNGTVWVVDSDDDRVVLQQKIRSKQVLVVTPDKDRVAIDGRTVYDQNLVHDHTHKIYFDRD